MKYFESDRLIFRDWEKSDLELFINMNKDSDVMKYFPNKLTSEESINFYQKIVDEFKKEGFG
ncbi:MAG: GNAT family N-acetyltransferase, partial [Candidatus Muiribacterium halophilum]